MATINSIYDVTDWQNNHTYNVHDPVAISGYFRYSKGPHTVTAGGVFSGDYWQGLIFVNNEWKPEFVWKPQYPLSAPQNPRVRTVVFNDGYEARYGDGINTNLIKLELQFKGKTYQEILAITHFLDARAGKESFYYTPPSPFAKRKLFVCRQWTPIVEFFGNYSMSCTFEEVAN